MTITKIYTAVDGKVFENEKDCLLYEAEIKNECGEDFFFLDYNGNEMPHSEKSLRFCTWLIICTDDAAQFLVENYDNNFLPQNLSGYGIWRYDNDFCDDWKEIENIPDEIEILKKVERFFMSHL